MRAIGKTVARVETRYDTVLIHFTDGSALEVVGSSHEEVSQYVEDIDLKRVRRRQREDQGARERERHQRLCRAGWMALSCDERAVIVARRDAGSTSLIPSRWLDEIEDDLIRDINRTAFGGVSTGFPERCPRCRERDCPNAKIIPIRTDPRVPRGSLFVLAGEIRIPKALS